MAAAASPSPARHPGPDPGWYTDPAGTVRVPLPQRCGLDVRRRLERSTLRRPAGARCRPPSCPSSSPATRHSQRRRATASPIAAMVCGIVSVVLGWFPVLFAVGAVLAVLAIIFGIVGLRRARTSGRRRGIRDHRSRDRCGRNPGGRSSASCSRSSCSGRSTATRTHPTRRRRSFPASSSRDALVPKASSATTARGPSRFTVYVEFRALPSGHTIERAGIGALDRARRDRTVRRRPTLRRPSSSSARSRPSTDPLPFGLELD